MTRNQEIAQIILRQMGGNKLIAMTGARNFVAIENGLRFSLPKFSGVKVNLVSVILEPDDTYRMKFERIYNGKLTTICECEQVYCDMLCATFEEATGLATSLFGETNQFA